MLFLIFTKIDTYLLALPTRFAEFELHTRTRAANSSSVNLSSSVSEMLRLVSRTMREVTVCCAVRQGPGVAQYPDTDYVSRPQLMHGACHCRAGCSPHTLL